MSKVCVVMTAQVIWRWEGWEGWGVQGAVFLVVKLHNEAQSVDASLSRLSVCLSVTCIDTPIIVCYNSINS